MAELMRERGYYWVSRGDAALVEDSALEVALWDGDSWYLCGYELPLSDEDLVIGERIRPE